MESAKTSEINEKCKEIANLENGNDSLEMYNVLEQSTKHNQYQSSSSILDKDGKLLTQEKAIFQR